MYCNYEFFKVDQKFHGFVEVYQYFPSTTEQVEVGTIWSHSSLFMHGIKMFAELSNKEKFI